MLNNLKKGFTLIELLVVITIIGILATGGLNIYTSQIQKARDSNRLKALWEIRLAVEQVYQDSSEYPHSDSFGSWSTTTIGVKTYMEKIPNDEKNGQTCYGSSTCSYIYWVSPDANWIEFWEYEISTAFENEWNINSKAEKDTWEDDLRYEIGIDVSDSDWSDTKSTSSSWSKDTITTPACIWVTSWVAPSDDEESIYLADDC